MLPFARRCRGHDVGRLYANFASTPREVRPHACRVRFRMSLDDEPHATRVLREFRLKTEFMG